MSDLISYWRHTLGDLNLQPLIVNTPYILLRDPLKLTSANFPSLLNNLQKLYDTNSVVKHFIISRVPKITSAITAKTPIDLRFAQRVTIQGQELGFFIRLAKIHTYNLFTRFFVDDTVSWVFEYIELGKITPTANLQQLCQLADRVLSDPKDSE